MSKMDHEDIPRLPQILHESDLISRDLLTRAFKMFGRDHFEVCSEPDGHQCPSELAAYQQFRAVLLMAWQEGRSSAQRDDSSSYEKTGGILYALSRGVNPSDGKKIRSKAILQDEDVISALREAAVLLHPKVLDAEAPAIANPATVRPLRAGAKWLDEDKNLLVSEYLQGASIGELADQFGRTALAIACQLHMRNVLTQSDFIAFQPRLSRR